MVCYDSSLWHVEEVYRLHADVRFPTSLTGDGTDAMYVFQPESLANTWMNTVLPGTRTAITLLHMSNCLRIQVLWDMVWRLLLGGGTISWVIKTSYPLLLNGNLMIFGRYVQPSKKWQAALSGKRLKTCSPTWAKHGIIWWLILSFDGNSLHKWFDQHTVC